jgi:hypothetical protein
VETLRRKEDFKDWSHCDEPEDGFAIGRFSLTPALSRWERRSVGHQFMVTRIEKLHEVFAESVENGRGRS